ncbi:MAG TPA: LicD family protein [Oscillospiraceae bacterium]|nr:LicD family protein [Oscillospiraceae bacterium]HPK35680.1 LicD family protein [Oscillospiraceae bacterium]HPR75782.1 LicD family protein [Oscillospiraceae bacterium]
MTKPANHYIILPCILWNLTDPGGTFILRELTLDEIRKIELEILTAFDLFCRENDLRYSLGFGTMIGAARHRGFIPWDDDIDVIMPRQDYMKFIRLTNSGMGRYAVESPYKKKTKSAPPHPYLYTKICDNDTIWLSYPKQWKIEMGVNIDVFPIDGLPADSAKTERHVQRTEKRALVFWIFHMSHYRKNWCEPTLPWRCVNTVRMLLPQGAAIRFVDRLRMKYPCESTGHIGLLTACYGGRERALLTDIAECVDMEFEGKTFKAMVGYDRLLRNTYGDYMTPPPPEERVRKHDFVAFSKE